MLPKEHFQTRLLAYVSPLRSSCESLAKVKCTASMGLHKIGVVMLGHQTRSNSKGMKAWPVRKLRRAWHVGAVSMHDFFKIRSKIEHPWKVLGFKAFHLWLQVVLTLFTLTHDSLSEKPIKSGYFCHLMSWRPQRWMSFVFEFQKFDLHPIDGRWSQWECNFLAV